MLLMALQFPEIDPEIFSIELFGFHIAVRWYALAYMVGLYLGWKILVQFVKRESYPHKNITPNIIDDFLTYCIIGVIVGGRLFGTLVYNFDQYIRDPLAIITPPFAGMSFHGGFLGVVVAVMFVAWRHKISILAFGDLMAIVAPIGLFFGRIANFINAELWGKETDVAWGMKFPQACYDPARQLCENIGGWFYTGAEVTRHPSQLYEAGLEGLVLGAVLWWMVRRGAFHTPGKLIAVFFIGYGAARVFVEFFRNADAHFISPDNPMGHVIRLGDWGLSMGQVLSLPMIFIGIGFWVYATRNQKIAEAHARSKAVAAKSKRKPHPPKKPKSDVIED